MALKSSRLGDGVLKYNDSTLTCRLTHDKAIHLNRVYKAPARGLILMMWDDPELASEVLSILQLGTEYTADEINDWLYGNIGALADSDFAEQVKQFLSDIIGMPYEKIIEAYAEKKEPVPAETKTT
uniref:Uncharacterized protein n=1 Tax=Caulobacter sp. (strain K31) TaxID=366602 RepID=B0T639_CAUSK